MTCRSSMARWYFKLLPVTRRASGLQGEDTDIAVNGTDISQDQSFDELVILLLPGGMATFTVLAGGETSEVQAVLGESGIHFSEFLVKPESP